MFCKNTVSGNITIFLSLLATIFLSLIATILYSSIYAGKKVMAENAADISMNSLFGEFNQKLLEDYDLFYIDIQDIGRSINKDGLAKECQEMADNHINYDTQISGILGYIDLLKLELPEISCNKYSLASDDRGTVYRQQAINYMKTAYPLTILNLLKEFTKDANYGARKEPEMGNDVFRARSGSEAEINGLKGRAEEVKSNAIQIKKTALSAYDKGLDNKNQSLPASKTDMNEVGMDLLGYVNLIKSGGILKYVWNKPLSMKALNKNLYISKRGAKNIGDGLHKDYDYNNMESKLLFNEYLLEHFGNALSPKADHVLQYEIEYILSGKESDTGNLKSTAHKLLIMREGANILYLKSDPVKVAEAEGLGALLATLLGNPEATQVMTDLVIGVWAFGESMLDLKELFDGKKVPVIKNATNFKLQISNITNIFSQQYKSCNDIGALDYKGYLRILLLLSSVKKNTVNSMDLIEANMRMDSRYKEFKMDACVEWAEFDFMFYINKDVHYIRQYGYIQ